MPHARTHAPDRITFVFIVVRAHLCEMSRDRGRLLLPCVEPSDLTADHRCIQCHINSTTLDAPTISCHKCAKPRALGKGIIVGSLKPIRSCGLHPWKREGKSAADERNPITQFTGLSRRPRRWGGPTDSFVRPHSSSRYSIGHVNEKVASDQEGRDLVRLRAGL